MGAAARESRPAGEIRGPDLLIKKTLTTFRRSVVDIDVNGFLIDLDGVLYVGKEPIPGVRELLERLDQAGYEYRFVSNSTRRRRRAVAERLQNLGYSIPESFIFTPPLAAVEFMRRHKKESCFLVTTGNVHQDFTDAGIKVAEEDVDYVVVGDAGPDFTFQRLNQALRLIMEGSQILALEMDRYWMEPEGLVLSTGPFVAALEYATGKKATLMGKPSAEFFQMGLRDLGLPAEEVAMVGDDINTDVGGAQDLGMKGILVKTGKYREEVARASAVSPDLVLDSLAHLGKLL
ncbi:MAG: TIGR01458 family HAD-type hydrolase [Methanosarcinales archaeon]|nr:TIGR01458 family HAD-type hydrolase [Methanosarcinales archaeon]